METERGVGAARLADHRTQFIEKRRQLRVERAARLGEAEPVVMAVEQRASHGMFERLDAARQRGHRQAELDRRRLDRAMAGDLEKGFHAAEGEIGRASCRERVCKYV